MARYKEYDYDIQDGKAIIPEWETEIKKGVFMGCEELTSVEFLTHLRNLTTSNVLIMVLMEHLGTINPLTIGIAAEYQWVYSFRCLY